MRLAVQSKLGFYIHPRYFSFTYIFSIILILCLIATVFVVLMYFNKNKLNLKDQLKKLNFLDFLFFFVVCIALILPPKSLSSSTVTQRESDLNNVIATESSINDIFNQNTKGLSIKDWSSTLKYNPDPYTYKGKEVDVVGFVFDPQIYGDNVFMVARFVITCCAVDSRPIGLYVDYYWKEEFTVDSWVNVKGKFDVVERDGKELLVIAPETIQKVDEPNDPYNY